MAPLTVVQPMASISATLVSSPSSRISASVLSRASRSGLTVVIILRWRCALAARVRSQSVDCASALAFLLPCLPNPMLPVA